MEYKIKRGVEKMLVRFCYLEEYNSRLGVTLLFTQANITPGLSANICLRFAKYSRFNAGDITDKFPVCDQISNIKSQNPPRTWGGFDLIFET